jgi:hypothetical protein
MYDKGGANRFAMGGYVVLHRSPVLRMKNLASGVNKNLSIRYSWLNFPNTVRACTPVP